MGSGFSPNLNVPYLPLHPGPSSSSPPHYPIHLQRSQRSSVSQGHDVPIPPSHCLKILCSHSSAHLSEGFSANREHSGPIFLSQGFACQSGCSNQQQETFRMWIMKHNPFTATLPKLALRVHSHTSQSSADSMVWTARPACLHAVSDPLLFGACA